MVRNLYRFYLYAVSIALLIFAAIATGRFLNTLLMQTALRGPDVSPPTQADIVQSLVFAIVAWVVVGAVGGLHYWLIRRDMRNDLAAGASAIRSFFLNTTEALGIALVVPYIGFLVLGSLGQSYSNVASAASVTLPTLALVILLELERRRTQAAPGAALVFQHIHFYGVQMLLLLFLTSACFSAIRPLIDGLLFHSAALAACQVQGDSYCPSYNYNLLGQALSLLWFVACWFGYGWMTRDDSAPRSRFILHGVSFAYGVGYALYGIAAGIRLIILPLFGLTASLKDILLFNSLNYMSSYDFVSPLILGILVVGAYSLWLRRAAKQGLINQKVLWVTKLAIVAILSAVAFWGGSGYILYNTLQVLTPDFTTPDPKSWVVAIAFVVVGLSYIPLAFFLRRMHAADPAAVAGPRRGFILALLGSGMLASAIGGVIALYAWITFLLGTPITNWPTIAHTGLATFLVGTCLIGVYLWIALREHLFRSHVTQPATPTPLPIIPEPLSGTMTIETVLDELQANSITRDEAATLIRTLSHAITDAGN